MSKTIWFISPYGALPSEPWRDSRFVVFAKYASLRGLRVVWWTAGFSHQTKCVRSDIVQDIHVASNFTIRLIPTTKYKNNIGLKRLISNFVFGWRVLTMGLRQEAPDCIVTGEPPTAFGFAGFRLAKQMKCKLIYDQIDLWPELFVKMAPACIRWLVWSLCLPVYLSRRHYLKRVDGVIGLAEKYLTSALTVAPNLSRRPHAVIYNGINVKEFQEDLDGTAAWDGIEKGDGELIVIYSGALGPSYDIESIIEAVELLRRQGNKLRLLIAGDGPLRQMVEARANAAPEALIYCGMVSSRVLRSIYKVCDIGIASYAKGSNVEMPDKFYDYTAAGLVIISSLQSEVKAIIEREQIGFYYEPGSVESCRNCLEIAIKDGKLRKEMASRSKAVAGQFSSEIQASRFMDVLEKVMTS